MPKNEGQVWFDLDLAVMDDEALVVLAQECEFGPARDELIVRFGSQTERLVRWLAHCQGYSHADVDDSRQNAVFWIVEAINKYDTNQIGRPQGCSFRSFAYRVVIARFKDFAKHLRRIEGHYDRTARCADEDTVIAESSGQPTDPATIAESQESMHRLQETLRTLNTDSGRLWQLLANGSSLRDIAKQLGVSYDSAKRRRRKLIEQLKLRLKSSRDSADFSSELSLG